MYVCVWECGNIHDIAHVCRSKDKLRCWYLPSTLFEARFLANSWICEASWPLCFWGFPCHLSPCRAVITDVSYHVWLYVISGHLNSGAHVFMTNSLPMETSPSPPWENFNPEFDITMQERHILTLWLHYIQNTFSLRGESESCCRSPEEVYSWLEVDEVMVEKHMYKNNK